MDSVTNDMYVKSSFFNALAAQFSAQGNLQAEAVKLHAVIAERDQTIAALNAEVGALRESLRAPTPAAPGA